MTVAEVQKQIAHSKISAGGGSNGSGIPFGACARGVQP